MTDLSKPVHHDDYDDHTSDEVGCEFEETKSLIETITTQSTSLLAPS